MPAKTRSLLVVVALLRCSWPTAASAAAPTSTPGTSTDLASLPRLQTRVRAAASKVMPSVVAVESALQRRGPRRHKSFASGVIVAADGLILSQRHVSHSLDGSDLEKSRKPGERTKVILHDGREREAELLGADSTYDLSLLRLVEAGPYPHAPLKDDATVKRGDWVLQLGHPGGFRRGRSPAVRLGRVLQQQDHTFVTDCQVMGGDSGAPLFDLDGRLVGIIRSDVGVQKLQEFAAGAAATRRIYALPACSTTSLIRSRLDSMTRGELSGVDSSAMRRIPDNVQETDILPVDRWTQGAETTQAYTEIVNPVQPSVVVIQDGDETIVLGTVVGADGYIVTKASELPAESRCRLPDGKVVAAKVVGVDPAFDLALLEVPATGLRTVEWADEVSPTVGTILAAPGPQDTPLAIGIVSVPRRDREGPFPKRMASRPKRPAALPELIGSPVQGRGYWVEYVEGKAFAAGIRPGDVILTVGGKALRSHQDLARCVKGRWAGERAPVRLLRAGKALELTLELRAEGQRPFSRRKDKFPTVFETHAPLLPHECGGPLVGLDGTVLGITIASVGPHGCMAIPGDCIQRLLPDLKSGKLAANWIKPERLGTGSSERRAPKSGEPVILTLGKLKERLTERAQRFKSLSVEYEVVSEAHVAPQLLMAWNMHHVRDYREHHGIAFAGRKRYSQVLRPEVMVWYAPRDQIIPDPNAPPEVVRAIERQRRSAADAKAQGRSSHLFARTRAEERRYVFDGTQCFLWDFRKRFVKVRLSRYHAPNMYLAGLGLRPIDPQPRPQQRAAQRGFWFPDNFALYQTCRILPAEVLVDGAPCVVVEAESQDERNGKRRLVSHKIFFDPKLGYAPRKWERRVDRILQSVRSSAEFMEFAPACWLPWQSTWTVFTPAWVAPEMRNQPAYSYNMRLRNVRVNDVSDDRFRP